MSDKEDTVITQPEEVPVPSDEPITDIEKIEEEHRLKIEKDILELPEGPEKILRTHGVPETVYKMKGDQKVEISLAKVLAESKEIGLYFSASWCDPCKGFTPKLIESYTKINSEKYEEENKNRKPEDIQAFEIILLPVDRDVNAHEAYFSSMPWLSCHYEGVAYYRMKLCEAFSLESIPSLLIFDAATGTTNTAEGVDAVERHGTSLENFPWVGHTKPLMARLISLVMSKIHLLAIMAFMMFRNYTSNQQMNMARTATTTTTAVVKAIAQAVTDECF